MNGQREPTDVIVTASESALCRGILYSALALGFRRPTEETLTRLGSLEAADALAEAAVPLDPLGEHDLAALASQLAL